QFRAEGTDRDQAAGKTGDRAGGRAAEGGAAHQHAGVFVGVEVGLAFLERSNIAANLLRIDLFEQRPEDLLEHRVGPLLELPDFPHCWIFSRSSSTPSWTVIWFRVSFRTSSQISIQSSCRSLIRTACCRRRMTRSSFPI